MAKFKIFYSWQSDLSGSKTRYFIRDCIDDAIAFAGESEALEAIRDEATKDMTGSPNIVTTLFSKIDECDLFVADVTLCFSGDTNKNGVVKRSPNPNVLLELGYAVKTLGWDRIICFSNTDFGSDYPFDIAQNRRTPYSLDGKDRNDVRRKMAKTVFTNIQMLKGQVPRSQLGQSVHIIGSYDYNQKKVLQYLAPLDIDKSESYLLHNKELTDSARQLIYEVEAITARIKSSAMANERAKEKSVSVPLSNNPKSDTKSLQEAALSALAASYKSSGTPVKWINTENDKSLIKSFLNIDVDDYFFNLGNLKISKPFISRDEPSYIGTDDEKEKFDKLHKLVGTLVKLKARTDYLKTFEEMKFIPLAIQNISTTSDTNISVVVYVETGVIVEPSEYLICKECEGMQTLLCSQGNELGIIPELFLLDEDGVIHSAEKTISSFDYRPNLSFFAGAGFLPSEKTLEDYKIELKDYIATTDYQDYYEFDVQSLRPGECRWLSEGLLIKPVNGIIKVNYRIHSDHSTGELTGKIELRTT